MASDLENVFRILHNCGHGNALVRQTMRRPTQKIANYIQSLTDLSEVI